MLGLSELMDSMIEDDSVNTESLIQYDVTDIQSTVAEKKKYFEEKTFFSKPELMFRVWRMTFLDLMKKDGFTKQVREFNDTIRQKNEQKRLEKKRKKFGNDVGSAIHSLSGELSSIEREIARNVQNGRMTKARSQLLQQKNQEKERTIVHHVQKILRSGLRNNRPSKDDFESVAEAIEVGLRGHSIKNRKKMRDLIDSVKSTLGVFIKYNDEYWNTGANSRATAQENAYLRVMEMVGMSNATSEHLDEISNSDIGFITVSEYKDPELMYDPHDSILARKMDIKGESTDRKRNLRIQLSLNAFVGVMVDVDDDDFYTEKVHYELMRRSIKNQWLLHAFGIYGQYQKMKERSDAKKKAEELKARKAQQDYYNQSFSNNQKKNLLDAINNGRKI